MAVRGGGGHADAAAGAKLAIVTTRLTAAAGPKICDRVNCLTTPGESIDVVVTEAGVAVDPRLEELSRKLVAAGISVQPIERLRDLAYAVTAPKRTGERDARIVGVAEYRDGSVIDVIRTGGR